MLMMGMFKAKLRFGNIVFMVETKEQWDRLIAVYGKLTLDDVLMLIHQDCCNDSGDVNEVAIA